MMVSSLSTNFSSIVRLIPLGSSSAETLYPIVKSTICDIEACGVFVEAVCTDNYPLNVRLYKCFSADSKLRPKVQHPCNPQRNLILFFDIVHIIKSIRNNWLNLKILTIHSFFYAPFEDIRNLFKSDKCNVLKRAPKLTAKACCPSRLERQNVSFALKIYHETTIACLLAWKMENKTLHTNQTVQFLEIINKVWKIFNVNWVGKNIRFNDEYSAPISPSDFRLTFLNNVVTWLDCWVNLPFVSGKLTAQTFTSFRHTCEAFSLLVKLLTENCGYQYFLTSRIQNDALEHHFGLYRQMSGSHYQISFSQILESERRLQLSNILKVFNLKHSSTSTESTVSLKEFLNKFADNYDCLTLEQLDIEHYLTKLNEISLPEIDVSQTESRLHSRIRGILLP